jgi:hypothetical protein
MAVVFAFGSRPALDAKSIEELSAALDGQETSTAAALASRLRAASGAEAVEVRLETAELEALLAALVALRGVSHFSELQGEAVAEYVGRPREPRQW